MDFHKFLQTIPDFKDIPNSQLAILERSMLVSTYRDGHMFTKEGGRGDKIFLLVDGHVSVTHNKGSQCGFLEIKKLYPGEWFGLISILGNGHHEATCTAIGDVTVAELPSNAFILLYESNAPLAHQIQRSISRQVANDYRSLVNILRKIIFSLDSGEDYQEILGNILNSYSGPERRSSDKTI